MFICFREALITLLGNSMDKLYPDQLPEPTP